MKIVMKYDLYEHSDQRVYSKGNLTIYHYELLSKKSLKEVDKDHAIVFIPVALMEVHGDFLPIGTDYLESIAWARNVAMDALVERRADKKFTIIQFPPVPLGTGGLRGMRGTVNINRRCFRNTIFDIVDALVYAGFSKFFFATAHHGNTHAVCLEEVVHKIMKKYTHVKVASPVNFFVKRAYVDKDPKFWQEVAKKCGVPPLTDEELYEVRNDHHSALMETSFTKTMNETWVDPMYKTCPQHLEGIKHSLLSLLFKKHAHLGGIDGCGYNGNPSRVDGRAWFVLYEEIIKQLSLEMVDALLDDPPAQFRFRDSFMWNLYLLRTNFPRYFLWPLTVFLFLFPWVSLFVPPMNLPTFQLWAILGYLFFNVGLLAYIVYSTMRNIKALGQEKHMSG